MITQATHPTVVCLTPVRNEAWILPKFLAAASLWADVIILADQGSTDGSAQIGLGFPKVTVIANQSADYSEAARQKMLISAARAHSGRLILVALDADEFLSPELACREWFERLAAAGPGAHARVPFFNLKADLREGWAGYNDFVAAWVDNGREHVPDVIHSVRLPVAEGDPVVVPDEGAVVMHWQFTAPSRMCSKHRWYQAWERLNRPHRSAVEIYRQYHHMNGVGRKELRSVPPKWLTWYCERGVDLATTRDDGRYWWDDEVLAWLGKHGAWHFRREAIWSHDWSKSALAAGIPNVERFADPRSVPHKLIHTWLNWTQRYHGSLFVRAGDKLVRMFTETK